MNRKQTTGMELKRIEAKTVREAMQRAEQEFGRDVLIVGTEQTADGYAIVAALKREAVPAEPVVTIPRADQKTWRPGFEPLADNALGFGLPESVVDAVEYALRGTRLNLDREGDPAVLPTARRVLAELIPTATNTLSHVTALVGPTGVGKTTTIAKLASQAAQDGERVAIVTTDTYRIAGVEQIRAYADLLDAPCEVAFTPQDLSRAIEKFSDYDRIFVDTTGRSPFDRRSLDAIRASLQRAQISPLVCLSANTRRIDAKRVLEAFAPARPAGLVVTKWDETAAPGEVLGVAIERKMPLTFVTVGQEVPDDIVPASAKAIAARAFPESRVAAEVRS